MNLRFPRTTRSFCNSLIVFNLAFLYVPQLEKGHHLSTGLRTLRILASVAKFAGCNISPCLMVGAHSLRHSCLRRGHKFCARSARAIFSGVQNLPPFGHSPSAEDESPNTSSNKLRIPSSRQGTSSSVATAR